MTCSSTRKKWAIFCSIWICWTLENFFFALNYMSNRIRARNLNIILFRWTLTRELLFYFKIFYEHFFIATFIGPKVYNPKKKTEKRNSENRRFHQLSLKFSDAHNGFALYSKRLLLSEINKIEYSSILCFYISVNVWKMA